MDSDVRAKVVNAETKRLYREILKKKMEERNQSRAENDLETLSEVPLPSFAQKNRLGLLECLICKAEFSNPQDFILHLGKARHQDAISRLKVQLLEQDSEISEEDDELLYKRDYPFDLVAEAAKPTEKLNPHKELVEKNQIILPKGFFDKKDEEEEFRKAEENRMKKLLKTQGVDPSIANQQDAAAIEDIRKALDDIEVNAEDSQPSLSQPKDQAGKLTAGIGRKLVQGEHESQISSVQEKLLRLKAKREEQKKAQKISN